ncbi:MAG TPA: undecaprenyldiphospho-muramoylpentapeptide beta-N-acetylglucosaminyltransferase [Cyclobacteriaceae bacterium]|nr:undecaprenyldiphospho-muramoylpentapeptide beta-N-acetylglucosaminyltransferase [Cyclobacteriaceae bacterium]
MNHNRQIEKKGRFIIAGGGTGGHIFPALAIAHALKKNCPDAEILFVGAKGKMEMEKVPEAGFTIVGLDIAGFNRSSLIKNISLPFKLIKSFFQVKKIVAEFKPDAVIGVGGYSSFPVLRYAQSKNIPSFIHESNSFAGKSNQLLGKKATIVFTATDGMEKFFPPEKIIISGNPIRQNLVNNTVSRAEAIRHFGLDENRKLVLSIGGSLGAQSINSAIAAQLDAFEKNDLQLIWQTGKPFKEEALRLTKGRENIVATDFIQQMDYAYRAADIVISRSGAMAIAELAVMKKPAVLVPYPFAAEDHQTVNAQNLVNKSAAIMVPNGEAEDKLIETVLALSKNEAAQQDMKDQIGKWAVTDADDRIANAILKTLEIKHENGASTDI